MGARTRGFANNVLTSGKIDATDGLTGNLAATNFADATVTNVEELPPAVGSAISSVAGNPAAPVAEGKIWYNTSTDSFNIAANLEAWSSGSPLITARDSLGSFGIQTASVGVGGNTGTASNLTEEYNGSGWSTGTNYPASLRWPEGTGTLTAGIVAGGGPSLVTTVNKYDGTSWTSANSLPTATNAGAMFGVQTSCVYALGYTGSNTGASYEFDGTTWTNGGTANTARRELAGSGTLTAGLVFGGSPATAATEEYDGTSWTASGNLGTARYGLAGSNAGTQTSSLAFAGGNPAITTNERYNGSTWSTDAAVATAARFLAGTGTASSALKFGGYTGAVRTTSTEEYDSSLNVITGAAWASGGNYPVSIREFYGVGTLTAGLGFNGTISPAVTNISAEYDGTTWGNTTTTNASKRARAGSGTQTAGLAFGGEPDTGETEEYNGTAWTEVNDLGTARYALNGSGTQTAGLAIGGRVSAASPGAVEEYDGSTWTAGGTQPSGTSYAGSCGTQTATLVFGSAPSATTSTFEYNGSTWTAGGNLTTPVERTSGAGTQTSALQAGNNPASGLTSGYDGTSWSTRPSMSTGRHNLASSSQGTTSSSMVFGGNPGAGFGNSTEEFTGETSALNVESLTTS